MRLGTKTGENWEQKAIPPPAGSPLAECSSRRPHCAVSRGGVKLRTAKRPPGRWARSSSPYALPSFVSLAEGGGAAALSAQVAEEGVDLVLVNRARVSDDWERVDLDARSWELSPETVSVLRSWRLEHLREVVRDDRYVLYRVLDRPNS